MNMLLCAVPILWAAVSDYRKRIIPDWTWIAVLLIGSVSASLFNTPYIPLLERILGLLLPGVSLLLLAVKYGGVGGGDIKLTAAMGFSLGLFGLVVILFFALLPACIYAKATKQKSVPLAVFLCVGFFAYAALFLFS
ncbi:A24 family peptidase [Desulfosporosinus sp. BG]|uniref:prepilin peptidase n=1 Tax=Desulfosporosinus sp. BG TaxID=1633135 RepID=UPI001FA7BECC|nr:A24 family peptidase [Desulfosporosinus sp. BG]